MNELVRGELVRIRCFLLFISFLLAWDRVGFPLSYPSDQFLHYFHLLRE